MPEAKKKSKTKKRVSRTSYLSKDYFIDCEKEGMLYAALVRSPLPTGKITNINFSDLPEGYFFFSARDIPGVNEIQTMNSTSRVFCNEKVHYMGQPVGIICGPDLETARQLAKEIQITFDITTIESALQEAKKNYHHPVIALPNQEISKDGEIADFVDMMNIMPALDELPATDRRSSYTQPSQIENAVENINPLEHVERLLAKRTIKTGFFSYTDDEQIIKDEYSTSRYQISDTWKLTEQNPEWLEPAGAFCVKEGSKLYVMTTTQWSTNLSKNLSRVLDFDEEKIVIQKTLSQTDNIDGIFRCALLSAQTALASLLTEKPVKLVLSKEEQNIFMNPGLDTKIHYQSAIEEDGTIRAMRISVDCDAGYSNPFAQEIADRLAIACCGLYDIENLSITIRIHSSENPPTSIYTELIDSQAFFSLENHIQHISEKTSILPDEIRLKNINLDDKKTKSPFHYKLAKPVETMNAIINQSDFSRKYASFKLNSIQNRNNKGNTIFSLPRRGIGLSVAYDGACFYGTQFPLTEEKIELILDEEENLVINAINPSATNYAIWKKIASEELLIDQNKITINPDYAVTEETFMPDSFYNDISIMTVLLKRACSEINKKRKSTALPIVSRKTVTPAMKNQWKKEKFTGYPFQSTSFGAAIVEVDMNADTYHEKINGIWIAIDCGEILSLKAAENTVRLAIQQEMERLVKDTTVSYDQLKISFLESKNPPCQIGKLVHNLIPAAFSSAVTLALSRTLEELPCTEFQLYEKTLDSTQEMISELETLEENLKKDKPVDQTADSEPAPILEVFDIQKKEDAQ